MLEKQITEQRKSLLELFNNVPKSLLLYWHRCKLSSNPKEISEGFAVVHPSVIVNTEEFVKADARRYFFEPEEARSKLVEFYDTLNELGLAVKIKYFSAAYVLPPELMQFFENYIKGKKRV